MPGNTISPEDARPLSAVDRIKSQKALAAAAAGNGNGGGSGDGGAYKGETYTRGAKGQREDMDRLIKLDWTQVSQQSSWHARPQPGGGSRKRRSACAAGTGGKLCSKAAASGDPHSQRTQAHTPRYQPAQPASARQNPGQLCPVHAA